MSAEYDNDELVFLDEDSHQELDDKNKRQWNILIVDDDEEIHTVTKLALSGLVVHDRTLNFLHANSGKQAKEVPHFNAPDTETHDAKPPPCPYRAERW